MFNSPLEQFQFSSLITFFNSLDLFFSVPGGVTSNFFIFFAAFLIFNFTLVSYPNLIVPRTRQVVVEAIYSFTWSLFVNQIGLKWQRFYPLSFIFFLFAFFFNILGLVPFGVTIFSQIFIIFVIAFGYFIALVVISVKTRGVNFFSLFFPTGAPAYLSPIMVPIELLSLSSRPFSLSTRLFSNMVAGHVLLKILLSFSVHLMNICVAVEFDYYWCFSRLIENFFGVVLTHKITSISVGIGVPCLQDFGGHLSPGTSRLFGVTYVIIPLVPLSWVANGIFHGVGFILTFLVSVITIMAPVLLVLFFIVLEFFVAILQAYVFCLLTVNYLKDFTQKH